MNSLNPSAQEVVSLPLERLPRKRKAAKKLSALAATAALSLTSVIAGCSSDTSQNESTEPTMATIPAPTTTEKVEVGTFTESHYGDDGRTVRIDRILPTDEVITATRPNGDTIQVPRIRGLENTHEFSEGVLALFTCYMTTGDEACMSELSENVFLKTGIQEYTELLIDEYLQYGMNSTHGVFHDSPEAPVKFVDDGNGKITIEEGTLMLSISSIPDWQVTEQHANGFTDLPVYEVQNFWIEYNEDQESGEVEVIDVHFFSELMQ